MVRLIPTVKEDIPQIREWSEVDQWHHNQNQPDWWITGSDGFVAGCAQDDKGPVFYLKVEEEEENFRLHVQFAPQTEVSRKRLIIAMREVSVALFGFLLSKGKGIIFNSENPSLVRFMWSMGFTPSSIPGEYILKC